MFKKKELIIIFGMTILFPIITGLLVSIKIFNLPVNNEWIGFYGGLSGGLLTLVGVVMTIKFTHAESNEQHRREIKPYLSIKHRYNKSLTLINEDISSIGIIYIVADDNPKEYLFFFEEIDLQGIYTNIGLGPAVNIRITDITIGNKSLNCKTNDSNSIVINGEAYYHINLCGIGIFEKELDYESLKYFRKFYNKEENLHEYPELKIAFNFNYEDMLGNNYIQKVNYYAQVIKKNNAYEYNILFKSIEQPKQN